MINKCSGLKLTGRFADFMDRMLFTPDGVCPMCEKILFLRDDFLCADCREKLPQTFGTPCARCGKPLNPEEDGVCKSCLRIEMYGRQNGLNMGRVLSGGCSWLVYGGGVRNILSHIKSGHPQLAEYCGYELGRRVQKRGWPLELVVPVPVHAKRLFERGYNQSLYIASGIAECTGLPFASPLARTRRASHQIGRGREDRLSLLRENPFDVIQPELLSGKTVLVVDDVMTTGATLYACADKILHAGAKAVYCGCVAVDLL